MLVGKLTEFSGPILFDGAMGTELIARGWATGDGCPEAWNVDRPEEVRAVHASYVKAGANVLQTNTFGVLGSRLSRFGLENRQSEIIRQAVDLARSVAHAGWLVGSIGPSGETLPLGAVSSSDAERIGADYESAAEKLAAAGVDAIHLETQFHPGELAIAIAGVKRGAGGLPLFASITLMPGVSGLETPHGVPADRMFQVLADDNPDVVGINCSIDAERALAAVRLLGRHFSLPMIAQPQAKLAQKCVVPKPLESPEQFATHMIRLVQAGATFIGGCCGVGPAEILATRKTLDLQKPVFDRSEQEIEMEAIL